MNYTGVPLSILLGDAGPDADATKITVRGTDGYTAEFVLADVMSDDELIITYDNGLYTIVAGNYEGAYWVEDVAAIDVR
jgi:DMSO/TMAO reductase YedYZ molybdopterin-dependent catalytic subunit